MSDTIAVGDRVTWTDGIGTVCIGTVMVVGSYGARVQLLDSGELRWPALDWLTKLDPEPTGRAATEVNA